jgi:inhibitor of Bruton tyrosine kinase
VTEFKDSALEYLCLQLESMLENHLLSDLDDDLLLELDGVVRANQLNCLPFAKSGRAELLLHDQYPDLAEDIHEERQRRVRDMTFRANLNNEDIRVSSSYKARVGSLDDLLSSSPSQDKSRRKSKAARNAPFSPSIRPKDSTIDLMFDMDDDAPLHIESPRSPVLRPQLGLPETLGSSSRKVSWDVVEPKSTPDDEAPSLLPQTPDRSVGKSEETPHSGMKSWSSPALPSPKLDMREIMSQASSSRTSALSMSLSAQKTKDEENIRKDAAIKTNAPKLSQKERKKQQQQAMQQAMTHPTITLNKADGKPASPWQVAAKGLKTSLKDVLSESTPSPPPLSAQTLGSPIPSRPSTPRRTASPDTRFAGQRRAVSSDATKPQSDVSRPSRPLTQSHASKSARPVLPHSKSYTAPAANAEPSLQLSMADIIGQQRREQEVIKEAVAKRSLQEIQEEQAFQEWWDQESRRAQEEEAARVKPSTPSPGRGGKSNSGRGKAGRGRGRGRGRGDGGQNRGRGEGQAKVVNNAG